MFEPKEKLELIIAYKFHYPELLIQALTHSSHINESRLLKTESNERLEFLGDAVLEIIVSDYLYHRYAALPEGDLTRMRAGMVCESSLAEFARSISLGDFLILGKGEAATGGRERNSVLADAVEALLGAIYLDGGLEIAREFLQKHFLGKREQSFIDFKTLLQEKIQKTSDIPLSYQLIGEQGPDHKKEFVMEVWHDGQRLGRGAGGSKKAAQQQAAKAAMEELGCI